MSLFPFTYRHKQYIIRNRKRLPLTAIAAYIGCKKGTLRRYMNRMGLLLSRKLVLTLLSKRMKGRTTSTPAIDKFLRKHYLVMPVKTIATEISRSHSFVVIRLRQLKLIIPQKIIDQRKLDSQFKRGTVSPYKGKKQKDFMSAVCIKNSKRTRFKKGCLPHNTAYDGAITIHKDTKTGRPYKWIRLGLRKWKTLHVKIWEDKHGPAPTGKIIVFRNKDSMDVRLRNLKMIDRKEHMQNNTIHRYPAELKQVIRLNSKLKRRTHELRKRKTST